MAGRQAHGRPLTAGKQKPKAASKKSKARSQKNALNAFGIAQENFAPKQKRTPRAREMEIEVERKHSRNDDEDDEDEDEDEEPQRKKVKRPQGGGGGGGDDDAEYGSDSEGNEWRLGGLREDDEDSEIESDDAFGDSDEEKFQGYAFRGSKSTQNKDDDSEDDSQDDEGETLGNDAIDLATALDQWEESSSEEEPEQKEDSSSDEAGEGTSDESIEDSDSDADSDSDEEASPEKLEALQGLIAGYGGEGEEENKTKSRTKIDLSDLGLTGINDAFVKKSMKLMNKEEKEKRPASAKKLAIPLAKRQQDRLDRSAAYEKTNETLDRWNDTVKHNRRAEHLIFPLPQNSATAGLDTTEIQPIKASNPSNELEAAILGIMTESGLSLEKPQKPKEQVFDEDGNELTRKEVQTRKRMERELASREAKRAKRIKKIKSKAYHRVHRRQRERDDMATREAMEEAGEIDSEEEREAQDRRRAVERVGQRHKDSRWAKLGSKAKRAVWDDDFRAGLTEMARKDEELRARKEGRTAGGSDEDSDMTSDSDEDGDASLRRKLDALDDEDDEEQPKKGLMALKFMQKSEAAKKQANDAMIKEIRKELDGEDAEDSDEEPSEEVGRRQFGGPGGKVFASAVDTSSRKKRRMGDDEDDDDVQIKLGGGSGSSVLPVTTAAVKVDDANPPASAWSRGETRRKKKGQSSGRVEDLDITADVLVASSKAGSKRKPSKAAAASGGGDDDNDDDSDSDAEADRHLPLAIRDQELVARAFAGEDVVGEFEREKDEVMAADDDKVIDNTLPGWGSWVGDGVSSREKKRHQGRFLTKVEGIKKKDRKDAKLDKVIINEKRMKKNDRYLASQLPHPFESREQYERSLRLPVGPEWMTKETFQDSTKPRVIMKQGIIAPMSKPTI